MQEACRARSSGRWALVMGRGCSGLEVFVDGGHVKHHVLPVGPLGPHHLVDVLTGRMPLLEPGWPVGSGPRPACHTGQGAGRGSIPAGPRAAQGSTGLTPTRVCPAGHCTAASHDPGACRCGRCCREAGGGLSCDPGLGGPHWRAGDAGQRRVWGSRTGRRSTAWSVEEPQREAFRVGTARFLDIRTLHVALTSQTREPLHDCDFCLYAYNQTETTQNHTLL